jgi:UDP-N-acetylmuramyl pentapeptide phosphotransferase/UDP-N-acetylglucosamine-1-phosphate transferase
MEAIYFAIAAAAATWVMTGGLLGILRARAILDHPNERSSHCRPVPRGGGIALIGVALGSWAVAAFVGEVAWDVIRPIAGLCFGLALVSWADDLRGLPALPRLTAQAAAVAIALLTVPLGPLFPGPVAPVIAALLAGLAWLWFINLFNFMDGIDGIAGVEAASVAGGAALVAAIAGMTDGTPLLAAALAGATLGFLAWNWQPAKLFLGDVGSVPLGFLLGWLLLSLAAHGQWAAALILPGYFLADATWTLARRALRGAPVWRAHKEHVYQRAVQAGASHAQVSAVVAVANFGLIACAAASVGGALRQTVALAVAIVIVGILMWYLRRGISRAQTA